MSLRVLTGDVTVAAGAITQDTTSGVGNGSQTTLATLWAPLWPTTFRKGTVIGRDRRGISTGGRLGGR